MTRSVDELVKAIGVGGISKSQVSRLCEEIDQRVKAFLDRPIEGDWPYLWIDATYVKVRHAGRIVSVAVIVAVRVNADSRREVLGMDIGPSEAETFWTAFLTRRALVKLVVSDAHETSRRPSPLTGEGRSRTIGAYAAQRAWRGRDCRDQSGDRVADQWRSCLIGIGRSAC